MHALPEIDLPPGALVIADLHLDVEEPRVVARFLSWLESVRGIPRLVILGDLFEFWVGPAQLNVGEARRVARALAELVAAGTAIDVVPGNRDFLLDAAFERESSCVVHLNGFIGRCDSGRRVLFIHGDELATLDRGHVRFRRVMRSRPLRWFALRIPTSLALGIARRLRAASGRSKVAKREAEMELQADAVRAESRSHDATVVICGHAHVWKDVKLDSGPRWVILDAFGGERDTLEVGPDGALLPRAPSNTLREASKAPRGS